MKKYEYVIWDFNGTILDDVEASMSSVNKLLVERGLDPMPDFEFYREVFDFPIKKYYAALGFDFVNEPYEVVAPLWVELYNEAVKTSTLKSGVLDMMKKLKRKGVKQYILSATELEMLRGQLRDLGITEYFEEVLGLDNIHAESKVALGKKLGSRIDMAKALMIGDTVHDYETAVSMGCDIVLVEGGHQSRRRLLECTNSVEKGFSDILEKYF